MKITAEQIRNWFTYHAPTPEQQAKYDDLRMRARSLALEIAEDGLAANIDIFMEAVEMLCPAGVEREQAQAALSQIEDLGLVDLDDEDRADAIVKLREAVMWANAAIACAAPEEPKA